MTTRLRRGDAPREKGALRAVQKLSGKIVSLFFIAFRDRRAPVV